MQSSERPFHKLQHLRRLLRPTPIVPLEEERIDLFAKLETMNPTGSVKDRSALWILDKAIERGEITAETTVVESSSGNFAVSMAMFCRHLGLTFIPVVDRHITPTSEGHLRALCRRVEKVGDSRFSPLEARLARVDELRGQLPSVFWPDQYSNRDAALAHYEMTGGEVCAALTSIDYIFVGVSSAGTISGLSVRIKEHFPGATVVAVNAEGSVIFGGPARPRHIPGLGSTRVPELVRSARIDEVVMVSERDAVAGCQALVARHGLLAGGSTGSVYAAIQRYFARHRGVARPSVLFLCADRGSAYLDTVYNPLWVETTLGREPSA